MYSQKIAIIFDHIQDHSRLRLENKFWKKNQVEFYCVRQVYFTNSCQQIWGYLNQPFIILYITFEVKQGWVDLLSYGAPPTHGAKRRAWSSANKFSIMLKRNPITNIHTYMLYFI